MRYQSPVRWIGGKSVVAKWIVEQFPSHHTYVEPFGGGAAVLLTKAPSPVEVYNDLDDRLFRIFSVLRDRRLAKKLLRSLMLTPYSEREFKAAWRSKLPNDPIEAARLCIIRLRMAFGGAGSRGTMPGFGFGKTANQARQFSNFRNQLLRLNDRLSNVTVMSRTAFSVIEVFDAAESLIYCDPPYVPSSRKSSRDYVHEFSEDDHRKLAELLRNAKSKVIVSGYESDLYGELFDGWNISERSVSLRVARVKNQSRTELIWKNF